MRVTVAEHVKSSAGAENANALSEIFAAVARAGADIAGKIRLAGLSDVLGAAGAVNVQGEQQQKLDVVANDVMMDALRPVACVSAMVSEEDEEPVLTGSADGRFAVIFDPLDGSSNIDVNVNVGTIFSVQATGKVVHAGILAAGSAQVAAGYIVYGPSTIFVLTVGAGVASFTLSDDGEFLRSAENMRMPEQGPYYSANEANAGDWPEAYRAYLAMLLGKKLHGKAYSARYVGSLVADFHRTLLKGGVFLYPPTAKAPAGKLRLLYEANPLAMIAEQAGGMATSGHARIMDMVPEKIHQRTAFIVGGTVEVSALQAMVGA